MACMEHKCRECWLVWFDNSLSLRCPECGSCDTMRHFDEDWKYVEDDTDYEEQDDESTH